ncbi:AQG_2a_G0002110.mRNA.1.CDS.1 [Saccharomyces cerevisiae]|uniref:Uncharacterized protein YBL008W-A n=6 Tax=Saccharomyces cerevisiae TaxID=4932 RepID=YB008_YEAST|eukprot:NP_878046.1 hypothetical protein YBL008W-A [Saccharomyces cerevisiae S288C]
MKMNPCTVILCKSLFFFCLFQVDCYCNRKNIQNQSSRIATKIKRSYWFRWQKHIILANIHKIIKAYQRSIIKLPVTKGL